MDWQQILQKVYDPTQHALRVKTGHADIASTKGKDFPQLWKGIYDSTNNCLRVDLIGAPGGSTGGHRDGIQAFNESVDLTKSKLRLVS